MSAHYKCYCSMICSRNNKKNLFKWNIRNIRLLVYLREYIGDLRFKVCSRGYKSIVIEIKILHNSLHVEYTNLVHVIV